MIEHGSNRPSRLERRAGQIRRDRDDDAGVAVYAEGGRPADRAPAVGEPAGAAPVGGDEAADAITGRLARGGVLWGDPQSTAGEPAGYGVGWFVATDRRGHR